MGYRRQTFYVIAGLLLLTACQQQTQTGGAGAGARQNVQSSSSRSGPGLPAGSKEEVLVAGEKVYNKSCKVCHGSRGNGLGSMRGPSLRRKEYRYGRDITSIAASIRDGRPKGMPAFGKVLTPEKLDAVAQYVLSLQK